MTGKILIVNALMGSLFVYKMNCMLDLTHDTIKSIEGILRDFIWSGKRAKIALETLKKDRRDGGLRLVDLRAKQAAIKISWIFQTVRSIT